MCRFECFAAENITVLVYVRLLFPGRFFLELVARPAGFFYDIHDRQPLTFEFGE